MNIYCAANIAKFLVIARSESGASMVLLLQHQVRDVIGQLLGRVG